MPTEPSVKIQVLALRAFRLAAMSEAASLGAATSAAAWEAGDAVLPKFPE
jgi:hypothetical protein